MGRVSVSSWHFSTLYAFRGTPDASSPYGGLIADAHGNLYGTTYYGGKYAAGTVYQLSPGVSATGEWRDGDTSYYTVNCWRRLGDHAKASLHKGEPVVVKGRFHTRSYEDKTGRLRTEVEITADTVGHDLSRGISNYMRTRTPADAAGDQAASTAQAEGSSEHVPASDILDEEAIKQFERELDAGLGEDEFAPRTRDDDEDYGDDEHEAVGTPGTPVTPEASMPS